jgi:hypothetical protein
MKAIVYHGRGQKSLDKRLVPELAVPTGAIVRAGPIGRRRCLPRSSVCRHS